MRAPWPLSGSPQAGISRRRCPPASPSRSTCRSTARMRPVPGRSRRRSSIRSSRWRCPGRTRVARVAAWPESVAITGRAALRRAPCRRGDAAAPARARDRRHGGAGLEQSQPAHRNACRGPAGRGASLSGGRTRVRIGVREFPDIVMDCRLRRLARSTPGESIAPGFPGRW